jgi:uncharacterized membrane protein YagU involved in acid resistance
MMSSLKGLSMQHTITWTILITKEIINMIIVIVYVFIVSAWIYIEAKNAISIDKDGNIINKSKNK